VGANPPRTSYALLGNEYHTGNNCNIQAFGRIVKNYYGLIFILILALTLLLNTNDTFAVPDFPIISPDSKFEDVLTISKIGEYQNMKKVLVSLFVLISLCVFINAQSTATTAPNSQNTVKKPRKPVFKANKDQILQAQKMLKVTETGKMSKEDRAVLKTYQKENGLKATGSLNRATLEKMEISLTAKQEEIPVDPNSFAKVKSTEMKSKKAVFRASKEQVMQAQKMINLTETGKLSKEDREALKKYQTDNGLKATGTLNKVTLEKMGIELTDKQKEM
jgi:murein L,D-transpeptidase YcbB/YkuD